MRKRRKNSSLTARFLKSTSGRGILYIVITTLPLLSVILKILIYISQNLQHFQNPRKVKKSKKRDSTLWKLETLAYAIPKLGYKLRPKKQVRKKTTKRFHFAKALAFLVTIVFSLSFVSGILFWQIILKDLPNAKNLITRKIEYATRIYDRNGILLYTIYKDQKRTPVALADIPPQVRLATLAAEDKNFYNHSGFSFKSILRALYVDFKERRLTGGSTITQQLVKNTLLTPEKTLIRKAKEIVLSIQVEYTYSKDQILEMYLNEVAYGGTSYGVQEASRTYFGKDVGNLSLAEAALIVGLPQSPSKYSPFGNNPERAFVRQKEILRRMEDSGFITKEQRQEAENEKLTFQENSSPILAPHFVFYVRDFLEGKYGPEVIEQGGLDVTTTLDTRIQYLAEEIVRDEVEKLKNLNVSNASVVILDPKTGQILAMVGSKNYFDTPNGGNVNVAIRPRQPGSSIKVVNYAYALANGLTPATIIPDTPTEFIVEGQPPYVPKNYENDFRGNITLRSALAESRNIPAVKTLASYGVDKMIELGQKMGITTWTDPKNYGLSLTLGGGEVKLLDLAGVYATIANYGKRAELDSILKITDYKGKVVESEDCLSKNNSLIGVVSAQEATESGQVLGTKACGEQVLDSRVAFMITDILRDNSARSPSFGTNSLLVIKDHPEVAVKTGTSNDLRDNLAVGYTSDYVVAVWIGNNDNSPMSRIASGVTGASPIFNKIMSALLESPDLKEERVQTNFIESWPVPEGLVKLPICQQTGTLSCEGCPVKMEWFLEENHPERACAGINKEDQNGDGPKNPSPGKKRNLEKIFEDKFNDIFRRRQR